MYTANLNPVNPVGTIQSIEHTLRSLDKLAADQQGQVARGSRRSSPTINCKGGSAVRT